MREAGEPQLTFNWCKAFADFINAFTFGKGVTFRTPKELEAIAPALYQRVWETDNRKQKLLWEMGQQGGVSGDLFVKIAYEEPWVDPIGRMHPGRVRILPLNAAFCFPEWHPHDRERLIRFKLKYRFWGTALEGTRQVFTYTEIITDTWIEEYINDELINARPNPIGMIPVVPIANHPVSGSPWGLSDIHDIMSLNREYNEKATDISDIINYHAAPVTIITGAKASQLEKGPKKVWAGLPERAQVYNLELGASLAGPLEFMEVLKRGMHELTGVPEGALGQMQPISNTSGVALAIQYTPMMNRYSIKTTQYGSGLERINEIIMLTLAVKEPWTLQYDPTTDAIAGVPGGQLTYLDPSDSTIYRSTTHWPPPLPVDVLVKLNEIQAKMALGLESKRGALRDLGFEFPDEKIAEIFDELVEDAKEQGALDLLRASIMNAVVAATGMVPDGEGGAQMVSAGGSDVTSAGAPGSTAGGGGGGAAGAVASLPMTAETRTMLTDIVTRAYGTKIPQRRNPLND